MMALLMLVACASSSGVRVKSDRNPGTDFGRYASYAWARAPLGGGVWPARNDRTAFDWKVRELVDAELTRKGYAQGAPATAPPAARRASRRRGSRATARGRSSWR